MVVKMCAAFHHAVILGLRLIGRLTLMLIALQNPKTHPAIDGADAASLLGVAHHHKQPVLPIAGVGRLRGCLQNAGDQVRRHRIGLEPAHGARRIHGFE